MFKRHHKILISIIIFLMAICLAGCRAGEEKTEPPVPAGQAASQQENPAETDIVRVVEGQPYSGKEEVAAYLHAYRSLPPNYITKAAARAAGWDSDQGNLWQVTDHKSIGGDRFGNREGLLPKAAGREYFECDINYQGGFRGSERIIYSDDGLIFYTGDHYGSFQQMY